MKIGKYHIYIRFKRDWITWPPVYERTLEIGLDDDWDSPRTQLRELYFLWWKLWIEWKEDVRWTTTT
jgi:hypothetical protein